MVITEMDKGKEKLLAVARTYLYSVDIQIVDSAKYLRDKLGFLGNLFLFGWNRKSTRLISIR